jgi:AcrR family transcriptional regulator
MPPRPAGRDPSTRDRLVAAAYELLVDEGTEALTIQAVARRAGLTNGAVYANFAARHELLLEVALVCWSKLLSAGLGVVDIAAVDIDDLVALLAEQHAAPPGPEHLLLADVTSAAMRTPDTERMLRTCLERLRSATAAAIEHAETSRTADVRPSVDVMAAVVVDLYLGAITAKTLHLRQPRRTKCSPCSAGYSPRTRRSLTVG